VDGFRGVVRNDIAFAQDEKVGANLFHHLENMRAIKNGLALLT
jgi:hypothetical protein